MNVNIIVETLSGEARFIVTEGPLICEKDKFVWSDGVYQVETVETHQTVNGGDVYVGNARRIA